MLREVAVDLGTATIQIFIRGRGVVVEEPAALAIDARTHRVVSAGTGAFEAVDADPNLVLLRPLSRGTVDDVTGTALLVSRLLRPFKSGLRERTRMLVTVPSSTTPVERRCVREIAQQAGAASVELIEHPIAVALGSGLGVHEPIGTMVLSVGAGITEAAVMSLGSIAAYSSTRSGSSEADIAIKQMLRRDHGLVVTDRIAEEMKLTVGTSTAKSRPAMVEAVGHAVSDGGQMTAILEIDDVRRAMDTQLDATVEVVRSCLVQLSPELSEDVVMRGMNLAGGGALQAGLVERLTDEFDVAASPVGEPTRAAVIGAGTCLEAMSDLKPLFLPES